MWIGLSLSLYPLSLSLSSLSRPPLLSLSRFPLTRCFTNLAILLTLSLSRSPLSRSLSVSSLLHSTMYIWRKFRAVFQCPLMTHAKFRWPATNGERERWKMVSTNGEKLEIMEKGKPRRKRGREKKKKEGYYRLFCNFDWWSWCKKKAKFQKVGRKLFWGLRLGLLYN